MSQQRGAHAGDERRPVESPYLTSAEALVYLRLRSLSNLYRLMREYRLPYGRCGRTLRFDMRELDAWVKGHGSAIEMVRARKVPA